MQIDSNAFQSKSPSLEEGPTRTRASIEKSSKYRRCIDIIKVILYLELIIFVGWIGCIFISNYHLASPFKGDDRQHDLRSDDTLVNLNSVSTDDVIRWIIEANTIVSTEQSRTATTPGESTSDFVQTESITSPSNSETEQPDTDNAQWWSTILTNTFIPRLDSDISVEEENSSDRSIYDPSVQLEKLPAEFPNSGLIHAIDDQLYDRNVVDDMRPVAPFPLPLWQEKYKAAGLGTVRVEDYNDREKSLDSKLQELFEPQMQEIHDEILDFNESSPLWILDLNDGQIAQLITSGRFSDQDLKSLFESVDRYWKSNESDKSAVVETESTTPSSKREAEESDEANSAWKLVQYIMFPNMNHHVENDNVDKKSIGDEAKYKSPMEGMLPTDYANDPPAATTNSEIDDGIVDQVSDIYNDTTDIPRVEDENTSDRSEVYTTVKTIDFQNLPAVFPEFGANDMTENLGDSNVKDIPFPRFKDRLSNFYDDDINDSDSDYDVLYKDKVFDNLAYDSREKRSTESSSSEEKVKENDPTSSASSSSEEKVTKDCSRLTHYNENGELIDTNQTNINFDNDQFVKWKAQEPKPDCGGPQAIVTLNNCGEFSYSCPSS